VGGNVSISALPARQPAQEWPVDAHEGIARCTAT
jgi:hypothetical protein